MSNKFDLTMQVATIVSRGRHEDYSNVQIANEIMEYLERKFQEIPKKPGRGIGSVTQADLFRGV
jgi:hypothetical protein